MNEYIQKSATEWEWKQGEMHFCVRLVPQAGELIWAWWMLTSHGPVIDRGFAQTVEEFLEEGVLRRSPPVALLDALRTSIVQIAADDEKYQHWFASKKQGAE